MQRLTSITGALAQACSRICSAATPGCLAPGSCALLVNIRNTNTAHTPSTILRSSQLQPHARSLSDTSPLWYEHIQALAQCSHANRSNAATLQPGHHQTFAQRGFATRATQDTAGPAAGMLSAVPFTISRQEADAAFEAYHSTGSNILLSRPAAGLQKVKELYLPLWVCRARVESMLRGAEIGFINLVMRTNPATRQKVPSLEVRWRYVRPSAVINQYFSPEMPEMQLVTACGFIPLSRS